MCVVGEGEKVRCLWWTYAVRKGGRTGGGREEGYVSVCVCVCVCVVNCVYSSFISCVLVSEVLPFVTKLTCVQYSDNSELFVIVHTYSINK